MTNHSTLLLALAISIASPPATLPARADTTPAGFSVEVLVDGRPVREYPARGTRYIEALKGTEYAIRLRNPLGVRVAVALSVDGLNTIDAKRTSAANARKWVLAPYETVVISGWQTSSAHARQFYFTTEEQSYAQRLGHASDMGVVSAVFYRERVPEPVPVMTPQSSANQPDASSENRTRSPAPAAPSAAPAQKAEASAAGASAARDEYAATGIGRRTEHQVEQVYLDLESRPAAAVSLRYEFRQQLVKLGVLPDAPDRLTRRERARGFEPGWCPEPR